MIGKCALITGAAQGIGKALAVTFGQSGFEILGIDNDVELSKGTESELLSQGIRASFLTTDLADQAAVAALGAELTDRPPIDLLIHNAGINHTGRFEESTLDAQNRVLQVNLYAPLTLTATLLRAGRINREGSVVFLSSLSRFVSYPGASVYAATKDGLASYARSLSIALAPQSIHVLTVYPGPTRTAHARLHSPDNSREQSRMTPEDLAKRILKAVQRRQRVLVPGASNRFIAGLGMIAPFVAERAMKKAILDRLPS